MTSSPPAPARAWPAALVTLLLLVAAGIVGAVVWVWLWTPSSFTVSGGAAGLDEVALSQTFTSDAWYVVVAAPLGLLVGLVRRRTSGRSGLLDLLAAVVGSVAAAYVMLEVGQLLGPGTPTEAAVAALPDGSRIDGPLVLASAFASQGWASHVYVVMIAWPLGVLAGWSAELVVPALEPGSADRRRAEREADAEVEHRAQHEHEHDQTSSPGVTGQPAPPA